MFIFDLQSTEAIPKGFSSARKIKNWGFIGKPSVSLAGKFSIG